MLLIGIGHPLVPKAGPPARQSLRPRLGRYTLARRPGSRVRLNGLFALLSRENLPAEALTRPIAHPTTQKAAPVTARPLIGVRILPLPPSGHWRRRAGAR
jgi:hypothetical protein